MKRATLQDAIDADPCWLVESGGRERLEVLFSGRESLSARDIAESQIAHDEKVWALTRPIFLSTRKAVRAAIELAEQVIHIYESAHPGDTRLRRACYVAKKLIDTPSAVSAVEYKIAFSDALRVVVNSPFDSTDQSVASAAVYATESAMRIAPPGRHANKLRNTELARKNADYAIRFAVSAACVETRAAQIEYLLHLIEEEEDGENEK
jgi:hypothetical protein